MKKAEAGQPVLIPLSPYTCTDGLRHHPSPGTLTGGCFCSVFLTKKSQHISSWHSYFDQWELGGGWDNGMTVYHPHSTQLSRKFQSKREHKECILLGGTCPAAVFPPLHPMFKDQI